MDSGFGWPVTGDRFVVTAFVAFVWFDWQCADVAVVSDSCDACAMQDHRKLEVWRESQTLAVEIRRVTRRFPRTGFRSLQSQMVSAAESVVFNIVEGCASSSSRDFARFLDTSIRSCSELEAQLELAKEYGIVPAWLWEQRAAELVRLRRRLCTLRTRVISRERPPPSPPTGHP